MTRRKRCALNAATYLKATDLMVSMHIGERNTSTSCPKRKRGCKLRTARTGVKRKMEPFRLSPPPVTGM